MHPAGGHPMWIAAVAALCAMCVAADGMASNGGNESLAVNVSNSTNSTMASSLRSTVAGGIVWGNLIILGTFFSCFVFVCCYSVCNREEVRVFSARRHQRQKMEELAEMASQRREADQDAFTVTGSFADGLLEEGEAPVSGAGSYQPPQLSGGI
mmetsp:Transcript_66580/g.171339  ORF Transcript_66580/g.171339 Transcript_66580/m.171339 type:complete len:154 (+) Transcript_66580:99-560(+)